MQKSSRDIYAVLGKIGAAYDRFLDVSGYRRSVEDTIRALPFAHDAPLSVLDAGSGTGPYTLAVLRHFPSAMVTAFDLDGGLVRRLNENLRARGFADRARTLVGSLTHPPESVRASSYDLIITSGVLEYVPLKETARTLAALLAPGGRFLSSPVRTNPLGHAIARLYGCKPYSRQENIDAFTSQGLTLEKAGPQRPYSSASFKDVLIFKR